MLPPAGLSTAWSDEQSEAAATAITAIATIVDAATVFAVTKVSAAVVLTYAPRFGQPRFALHLTGYR